jgi:hypothetical protein
VGTGFIFKLCSEVSAEKMILQNTRISADFFHVFSAVICAISGNRIHLQIVL